MTETKPNPSIKPPLFWALDYAKRFGWYLLPLHSIDLDTGHCTCKDPKCYGSKNEGKHPRIRGGQGLAEASNDETTIRSWWSRWPGANIGLACGKSGLVVVDIDPRNDGDNTLHHLETIHGKLPETPCSNTGGGGQHYICGKPANQRDVRGSSIPDGIDLKADGGYIVLPPSKHISGREYVWDAAAHPFDIPIAEVPQWIAEYLKPKAEGERSDLSPADGFLGAAFKAAGMAGRDLGQGRMAVECPWESEHSSGTRFDGSTIVFAPNTGRNTGWFWCSHGHCQHKRTLRDVLDKLPSAAKQAAKQTLKLPENHEPPPESEPTPDSDEPWLQSLVTDGEGKLKKEPGNAALLLGNLPEWKGALRYNEFARKCVWHRPVPPMDGFTPPLVGEELADHHLTYVSHWLAFYRALSLSKDAITSALELASRVAAYNPLTEYLGKLKWDGQKRIDSWLPQYIGAEDSAYSRMVGPWWLISACYRAFEPGCQVDSMLILSGAQGAGKTTAFMILAGEFGLESLPDITDKDAMQLLAGRWICVMDELKGVKKSDLETIKNYVSKRFDDYRPSYGRFTVKFPRACVFGGTSNDRHCLPDDPTGNRRFWPVEVGTIDFERLTVDRDQLWAEAVVRYRARDRYWAQTTEEKAILRQYQDEATSRDAWESLIERYLATRVCAVELWEVLHQCLGVAKDKMTKGDQMRVSAVMKCLGWEPYRARVNGGRSRRYVPEALPDAEKRDWVLRAERQQMGWGE